MGKSPKSFVCSAIALLFTLPLISEELPGVSAKKSDAIEMSTLKDLHRDIILLNLINGLYLTPDQTRQLLSRLHEARTLREDFKKTVQEMEPQVVEALNALRSHLMRSDVAPEEIKQRAWENWKIAEDLKTKYEENLCALESEVIAILTENQLYLIENFKPCLFPPKDANIGQLPGPGTPGTEDLLERIRKMPDQRFQRLKDRFVDKHIEHIEEKIGIMTEEEKAHERQRLLDIFQKARTLSDVDFAVARPKLAQELVIEKPKLNMRKKKNELGNVGRFLLDERLIPILEERGAGK